MFSGTTSRLRANFRCKRFPSLTNDTATRYVVKREIAPETIDPRFATVTQIQNDPFTYTKNLQNNEIWLQLNPSAIQTKADTLYRLPYERITNNRHGTEYTTTPCFEATVKTLLKSNGKPMIYMASKKEENTIFTIKIPAAEILGTEYVQNNGLDALLGQVIRVTDMPAAMPQDGALTFVDHPFDVEVNCGMERTNEQYWIANVTDQDPFEVFVDTAPLIIASGNTATISMYENFSVQKEFYQPYFDFEFTAKTLEEETTKMGLLYLLCTLLDVQRLVATLSLKLFRLNRS